MENLMRVHGWKFQDASLLLLRLVVAAVFLYAGAAKWAFWSTPLPGMSDVMWNLTRFLSIVEPLGALALILGFLTRWAAAGLAIIMLGAIFILEFTMQTNFFTSPAGIGWDYNLLLLANCLALLSFGAGKWSLDAVKRNYRSL
ncbi:MAG: hypothetical protein ACD_56C00146G0005 [uncultured bacterium]|nr:MAG: hypothetical protein ACD_56C00146G0005 [uncultured bacterium]